MLYLAHNSLSISAIQKISIKRLVARKERFLWGKNFNFAKILLCLWTVRPRALKKGRTSNCRLPLHMEDWKEGTEEGEEKAVKSKEAKRSGKKKKIYRWEYTGICISLKTDRGLCSQYLTLISIWKILIGTKWCILTLSYLHWESTIVYL